MLTFQTNESTSSRFSFNQRGHKVCLNSKMALFSISQSKLRLLSPALTTGVDVIFSIVLHSVILLIELKSKH